MERADPCQIVAHSFQWGWQLEILYRIIISLSDAIWNELTPLEKANHVGVDTANYTQRECTNMTGELIRLGRIHYKNTTYNVVHIPHSEYQAYTEEEIQERISVAERIRQKYKEHAESKYGRALDAYVNYLLCEDMFDEQNMYNFFSDSTLVKYPTKKSKNSKSCPTMIEAWNMAFKHYFEWGQRTKRAMGEQEYAEHSQGSLTTS